MKLRNVVAAILAIVALTSCEDLLEENSLRADGSKPSLTINQPATNQTVTSEEGLRVYITAVDKDAVKDLEFVVRGSDAELFSFTKSPQKAIIDFDSLVMMDNVMPGTYQLIVRATDGRTNVSEQLVNFTVK